MGQLISGIFFHESYNVILSQERSFEWRANSQLRGRFIFVLEYGIVQLGAKYNYGQPEFHGTLSRNGDVAKFEKGTMYDNGLLSILQNILHRVTRIDVLRKDWATQSFKFIFICSRWWSCNIIRIVPIGVAISRDEGYSPNGRSCINKGRTWICLLTAAGPDIIENEPMSKRTQSSFWLALRTESPYPVALADIYLQKASIVDDHKGLTISFVSVSSRILEIAPLFQTTAVVAPQSSWLSWREQLPDIYRISLQRHDAVRRMEKLGQSTVSAEPFYCMILRYPVATIELYDLDPDTLSRYQSC